MLILVVDDEDIIRTVAQSLLRRKGYDVVLANSGAEGLAVARREGNRIALVLLDFAMPGLTGEQTWRELRTLLPEVPVVVMSGYARDHIVSRSGGIEPAAFLQKPFEAQHLLDTIQRLVSPPAP